MATTYIWPESPAFSAKAKVTSTILGMYDSTRNLLSLAVKERFPFDLKVFLLLPVSHD